MQAFIEAMNKPTPATRFHAATPFQTIEEFYVALRAVAEKECEWLEGIGCDARRASELNFNLLNCILSTYTAILWHLDRLPTIAPPAA